MLQASIPIDTELFAHLRAPEPVERRAARPAPPLRRQGAAVTLDGLSKAYGERTVLDAIGLHLHAGEFVAIVGRSGCGKSTLLRTIAGLDPIDSGAIAVGADATVRMMFQEPRLLPWKTVLENVALGLGDGGQPDGRAAAALAAVGLAERGGAWPAELSGGQRQRVALARALVHEPTLLLLDEPLGALDALTRIEMQGLLESLWRARGFTAILVTHDVQEAVALADRVLLIEEGRVTLDLGVDLPRPRVRGSRELAAVESRLLDRLLGGQDLP